ncbi:Uncharacterised protein [Porphyromonas cangingivalis]|nr:Uncharacterised protein [Porphyromonas cangingivalis]
MATENKGTDRVKKFWRYAGGSSSAIASGRIH